MTLAARSSPSVTATDRSAIRPDPKTRYLRIHAVNVFVKDQDRSLRFYLDQLGFSLAFDARLQSGQRWVAVSPPDGSAVLTLIAPEPDSEESKLIGRPSEVVFVTEDVTATYRSEERRVGKEGRARQPPCEYRKQDVTNTRRGQPSECTRDGTRS